MAEALHLSDLNQYGCPLILSDRLWVSPVSLLIYLPIVYASEALVRRGYVFLFFVCLFVFVIVLCCSRPAVYLSCPLVDETQYRITNGTDRTA